MTKEILKIIDNFYNLCIKEAGLIKVPDALFNDVFYWLKQRYIFEHLKFFDKHNILKIEEKDYKIDLLILINYLEKIYSGEVEKNRSFTISDYIDNRRKNIKKLKIKLNFNTNKSDAGSFRDIGAEIVINMPASQSLEEFKNNLNYLKATLHHELEHFLQYYSTIPHFGLPSEELWENPKVKMKNKSSEEDKQDRLYYTSLVEFYPQITSHIEFFNSLFEKLPEDVKLNVAKIFVGLPVDKSNKNHVVFKDKHVVEANFFRNLKNYAPEKWKKAVKEFFKAINI